MFNIDHVQQRTAARVWISGSLSEDYNIVYARIVYAQRSFAAPGRTRLLQFLEHIQRYTSMVCVPSLPTALTRGERDRLLISSPERLMASICTENAVSGRGACSQGCILKTTTKLRRTPPPRSKCTSCTPHTRYDSIWTQKKRTKKSYTVINDQAVSNSPRLRRIYAVQSVQTSIGIMDVRTKRCTAFSS